MADSDTFTTEEVAGCVLAILFIPASIVVRAIVVTYGWAWFVAPLGVPEIGALQAFGLHALAMLFSGTRESKDKKRDSDRALRAAFTSILVSLIAWGVMFAAHLIQEVR